MSQSGVLSPPLNSLVLSLQECIMLTHILYSCWGQKQTITKQTSRQYCLRFRLYELGAGEFNCVYLQKLAFLGYRVNKHHAPTRHTLCITNWIDLLSFPHSLEEVITDKQRARVFWSAPSRERMRQQRSLVHVSPSLQSLVLSPVLSRHSVYFIVSMYALYILYIFVCIVSPAILYNNQIKIQTLSQASMRKVY